MTSWAALPVMLSDLRARGWTIKLYAPDDYASRASVSGCRGERGDRTPWMILGFGADLPEAVDSALTYVDTVAGMALEHNLGRPKP